jgi:hypothetical protein
MSVRSGGGRFSTVWYFLATKAGEHDQKDCAEPCLFCGFGARGMSGNEPDGGVNSAVHSCLANSSPYWCAVNAS